MEENRAKNKKENHTKGEVADILRSSMMALVESDVDVYKRVISLADDGFFEQHQTIGNLRALADELLAMSAKGGGDSESN